MHDHLAPQRVGDRVCDREPKKPDVLVAGGRGRELATKARLVGFLLYAEQPSKLGIVHERRRVGRRILGAQPPQRHEAILKTFGD